jgi:hypothetical protein
LSDDQVVYWFYVNLRINIDTKNGYESYVVKRLGSQIFHGTINVYDHDLWQNLGKGTKMAIGPFYDATEAQQAWTFYEFSQEERTISQGIDLNKPVFYFVLRVEKRPRSGAYLLERIPGAVQDGGDVKSFDELLETGLGVKRLAIGPFWSKAEAEEAKRRYRLAGKDN